MTVNEKQIGGDHYKSSLQHWDLIEKYGVGYVEGCATKYLTRHWKKHGKQDLEKAVHYIEKLIDLATHHGRIARGQVPKEVIQQFGDANSIPGKELKAIFILVGWWRVDDLHVALQLTKEILAEVDKDQQQIADFIAEGGTDLTPPGLKRDGMDRPFGYDAASEEK